MIIFCDAKKNCGIIADLKNLLDSKFSSSESSKSNIGGAIMPQKTDNVNNKNEKTTSRNKRGRAFTGICYPENITLQELIEILRNECAKFVISPLHDADFNADNTQKKPHWHLFFYFDGKKSLAQIDEILKKCKGTIANLVNNRMGLLRYFCHLDNPEKTQYPISEVFSHNIDYEKEIQTKEDFEKRIRAEIHTMIVNDDICEYSDLLDKLFADENMLEHYDYACKHTILYRAYLQSRKFKKIEMLKSQTNPPKSN